MEMKSEVLTVPNSTTFSDRHGVRGRRADTGPPQRLSERAVIDRLQKLRVVLPAMARETAEARREAIRLRAENARLVSRLAEIEAGDRS
jgi:hypothetical protein